MKITYLLFVLGLLCAVAYSKPIEEDETTEDETAEDESVDGKYKLDNACHTIGRRGI